MERQGRGIPICSGRGLRSRLPGLGLMAALTLATLLLAAGPVQACVQPVSPDMWVIIRGDDIWIIIRGYETFSPIGITSCACGLPIVSSIASLNSGHVRDAATGELVSGYGEFASNPTTAASLTSAAQTGGPWFGLLGRVIGPIPPPRPIYIELHGKIHQGFTLAQVIGQLRTTKIGTAGAMDDGTIINDGHAHFDPPSVVDPASAAPVIQLADMEKGPPQSLNFTVRDAEDGLQVLKVTASVNAQTAIEPFTPGTQGPVKMSLTKVDDTLPASVTLQACNVFGECSVQKSTLIEMETGNQQSTAQHTFGGIRGDQLKVFFLNGDPGVRYLAVLINGHPFSVRPLASGQTLEADVSAALRPENNTVQVITRGASGSGGMLMLSYQ